MKKVTIRHLSQVSLLVVAALATCAFVAAANAQSSFTGKFTLPHDVHWGTVVLAAGDYTSSGGDFIFPCEEVHGSSFKSAVPRLAIWDSGSAQFHPWCEFLGVRKSVQAKISGQLLPPSTRQMFDR